MSEEYTISVIVPTYNRCDRLARLVDALAGQDLDSDRFEVIIISDGGTDHSADMLAQRSESFPARLEYIEITHAGPAAARNAGILQARGRIIAFTDDDCLPAPDWLSALLRAFNSDPGLCGVGGRTLPAPRSGLISRFINARSVMRTPQIVDGEVLNLQTNNAAFMREDLLEIRGFDRSFPAPGGEDWELCTRLRHAGKRLGYAAEAGLVHHHRSTLKGFMRTYYNYGRADAIKLRTDPPALQLLRSIYRFRLLFYWILIPFMILFELPKKGFSLPEKLAFPVLEAFQRAALTAGYLRGLPAALADRSPHAGSL